MGFTDIFKTKQFKNDIERLQAENEYMNRLLTPEMRDAAAIKHEIDSLNVQKQDSISELSSLQEKISGFEKQINHLQNEIKKKKEAED